MHHNHYAMLERGRMALPKSARARHRGKLMRHVFRLSWILLLLALVPAYAEIYKWIDREGRAHFSDTLAGVPPEYRDRVEEKASLTPTPRRDAVLPLATPEHLSSSPTPAPPSYAVPLRRDGNAMLVEALVSGTVRARLLLDTGAEFTVLSTAVARRLAVHLGDAAIIPLRSASGVFFAPMLKVPSLTVGDAVAYDVEVIVHDATPGLDGLLGMSFLDNFLVTISTSNARLLLTPLTDSVDAEFYGGHPKDWWIRKFRFYRTQIESLKESFGGRQGQEMERTLRYFRTALEALERQASQAGVPRHWRN
jgi:clan AA aspartic protease (TIGR02281 family)